MNELYTMYINVHVYKNMWTINGLTISIMYTNAFQWIQVSWIELH
jgi:hypothetical protein